MFRRTTLSISPVSMLLGVVLALSLLMVGSICHRANVESLGCQISCEFRLDISFPKLMLRL
mgnify:CR=1 FL=1|jgi:hypothetical protein